MKLIVVLILMSTISAIGSENDPDTATLIALENEWLTAKDAATLDRILAPDFVHPVVTGDRLTKAEQIAWTTQHPSPSGQHLKDVKVRVYGDTAVVNGAVVGPARKTLFTDVFVRREGQWQAVNAQENLVMPPAAIVEEQKLRTEQANVDTILKIFCAVEKNDEVTQLELYDPKIRFYWPPSLPYGGTPTKPGQHPTWSDTWRPLQPTAAEQRLDPRVIAAGGDNVVVLYHQRGISPSGRRFDGEVLGLYHLHDGKLDRAQMFYFDTVAVLNFLHDAEHESEPLPTPNY